MEKKSRDRAAQRLLGALPMLHAYHFVARARPSFQPLIAQEIRANLWARLQLRFSKVMGCVLMPNHLHLFLFTPKPDQVRWTLGTELRALTRQFFPGQRIWEQLPDAEKIHDDLHLKRQIRYVHLNPCRKELVRDPLEWEWSTHRDVVGAVCSAWVDLERMAELFKTSQGRLGEAVHRYASGDPSVSVAGTPYIRYVTGAPIRADMNYVIKAVASAARTTPDAVLKRGPARELAIQLATQVGITRTSEIQSALGISALTVSRTLRGTPRASALTAALRVLSDPRLLKL